MNHGDPTDQALAAIASLRDDPAEVPETSAPGVTTEPETPGAAVDDVLTEVLGTTQPDAPTPAVEDAIPVSEVAEITDEGSTAGSAEADASVETTPDDVEPEASPAVEPVANESTLTPDIDVDSYTRYGPGPLDALRFRWTARRDESGAYYVDETIGHSSRAICSGPMPREDVIRFIDGQEADAHRRFAELKSEITQRVPALRSDVQAD